MAERRMFSNAVIDSDVFLDMPSTSQSLYFLMALQADDEGFVANPKKITRMIGASEDDLQTLGDSGFIIRFASGIICIRHWKVHNSIRGDRFKATMCRAERALVAEDENDVYNLAAEEPKQDDDLQPDDNQVTTNPQPDDNQGGDNGVQNDGIGKVRLSKVKLINPKPEKTPVPEKVFDPPPEKIPIPEQKHKYGKFKNVLMTDSQVESLKKDLPDWERWVEVLSEGKEMHGYKYKNDSLAVRNWARREEKSKPEKDQIKWTRA